MTKTLNNGSNKLHQTLQKNICKESENIQLNDTLLKLMNHTLKHEYYPRHIKNT